MSKNNENITHVPFISETKPFGSGEDPTHELRELVSQNKIILRVNSYGNTDELQKSLDKFILAKELFNKLRGYGLRVPEFKYVIGENEDGLPSIFTVIDKVEGENLFRIFYEDKISKEKEDLQPELLAEVRNLFNILIDYLVGSYKNGKSFLDDIGGLQQYVHGRLPGDSKSHIYLVDIDPFVADASFGVDSSHYLSRLLFCMRNLVLGLNMFKKRTGEDIDSFRKQISKFLRDENIEEFNNYGILQQLKEAIKQGDSI